LRMARRTERHQIEVRAPLGALDHGVDLESAPAATGLAPPAGAAEDHPADCSPLLEGGRGAAGGARAATFDPTGAVDRSRSPLKGGRVQMPEVPERCSMARPGP
jgi:hypothetical protein